MKLSPDSTWEPLGRVSPDALREARLQLHHLVQIIPAFAGALVEPEGDDGHRSMEWDPDLQGFRSRRASGVDDLYLVVRPFPLEVQIRARGHVKRYVLPGHGRQEAFHWIARELEGHLGRPVALMDPEFEIPSHRVGKHALFDAGPAALEELAAWYHNATHVLSDLRDRVAGEATPLRAWPHHFDVAFRVLLPPSSPEEERSVGVGMSPGDADHPDPYWYVTPWPAPAEMPDRELPHGRWYTDSWVGGVLEAEKLRDVDAGSQQDRVREFLRVALEAGRRLLEH